TTFLTTLPKETPKYIQKTTLDSVAEDFSKIISATFPQNSPETKILTGLIHPIAKGLSISPESARDTLISTVRLTNYLSPSANTNQTLEKLAPIIGTLRTVHPNIKLLTSSTSSILQSHTTLSSAQLISVTNQFTLRYLLNPTTDPQIFASYFDKSILPQLEALTGRSISPEKSRQIFSDLHTHLQTNPLRFTADQQVLSSLTAHFTKAGLTPEQARVLAPKLLDSAKLSFYFSGYTPIGKNLVHTKALQAQSFNNIFKVSLESLIEANPALANLRFGYLNSRRVFEDLHTVLGNPTALSPEFLIKIQSPVIYSFTKYLEGYIPEPIRPVVAAAAKTLLGSAFLTSKFAEQSGLRSFVAVLAAGSTKLRPLGVASALKFSGKGALQYNLRFLNKYTGMKVAGNPVALAFRKNFQAPVSAAVKGVWTKFAGTAAGKAITAAGAKIAANAALQPILQAIGSAAPIIGNLIALAVGWVVGEVLVKLIDPAIRFLKELKDNIIPGATALLLGFGASMAGVSIIPSALIGLGGGLLTGGIQSAISGKNFGFSSQSASNAASKFNFVATTIATSAVTSTFSGVLIAIIAVPVVVAFFVYIITSSALVTPPTVYNTGGGIGFQNASSCPLASGTISTYSYDPAHEESSNYHGANGYWRAIFGTNSNRYCSYHLPSDGISCAPIGVSANYCYQNHPRCAGQNSPVYGYAIDVVSSDRNVSLPQINGQSPTWEYVRLVFPCNTGGCPHQFRTVNSSDGNIYTLNFLHMKEPTVPPGPYISGTKIGVLFDQGGNTHLHLEVQINDVYVKPENYFCNI
ncbi:MAG: hypothetical protein AAB909_03105, partial [Patescibacteria group bacterium]